MLLSVMTAADAALPCILVVEDDPETQHFMRLLLRKRYEVRLASSGEEMRRQLDASDGKVRVVLMDLSLKGGEDGLDLTRALRADPRWTGLRIVAVTAHTSPSDRAAAFAAGCDEYVNKPIDNQGLLALVARLVS